MKKFFTVVLMAIFAFALNANAQDNKVATLSHQGAISVFYGPHAYVEAYNAAADGDIITLSPGTFKAPEELNKAIVLRGSGIGCVKTTANSETSETLPTVLSGAFNINQAEATGQLKVEGIYFLHAIQVQELTNAQFDKCRFNLFMCNNNQPVLSNTTFINCRFAGDHRFDPKYGSSATFINSVFCGSHHFSGFFAHFINCLIPYMSENCEYTNCILKGTNRRGNTEGYPTLRSSLFITEDGSLNYSELAIPGIQTCYAISISEASNLTQDYADDVTYELTEEQKAKYTGTDGTEVGLYGGQFPYTETLSYPQITKFNVASKTSSDGKLKVEIEVNGTK